MIVPDPTSQLQPLSIPDLVPRAQRQHNSRYFLPSISVTRGGRRGGLPGDPGQSAALDSGGGVVGWWAVVVRGE